MFLCGHLWLTSAVNGAIAKIRKLSRLRPKLAFVLGSGFGHTLDDLDVAARFPYTKLPGFPKPCVPGHKGELVLGRLCGTPVMVMNGRVHYYEGYGMQAVTFGIRLLARLGVEAVLITSAAGGIHPRLRVGDFMMLTDHINWLGVNPLHGAMEAGRSRFVDLTQAYDLKLQALLRRAARRARVTLREGVYLAVSGPTYETPAEIRAFRRLGADAVGMSTVPEVVVARQEGLRVAGLSCITNLAAGLEGTPLEHQHVLEAGVRRSRQAARLIEQVATLYGRT